MRNLQSLVCFSRCGTSQSIELKHLVFNPSHMEDDWKPLYPGKTFGATSVLTAAMVRHLYEPGSYPFFIAASRALSAIRENHALGAGAYDPKNSGHPFNGFDTDAAHPAIKATLHSEENSKFVLAENDYAAVLVDPQRYGLNCHHEAGKCEGHANLDSDCKIDLLQDVTGYDKGFLAAKAFDRDFPYGLSLEQIQTRNLRDYNTTTSPRLMRGDFSPFSCPSRA